jgi:hypothetical protein
MILPFNLLPLFASPCRGPKGGGRPRSGQGGHGAAAGTARQSFHGTAAGTPPLIAFGDLSPPPSGPFRGGDEAVRAERPNPSHALRLRYAESNVVSTQ